MMITVIVDEIKPDEQLSSFVSELTYRRVERERFEAIANIIHNIACVGDELFFQNGTAVSMVIVQRCRPVIRTHLNGRVMSMWLDVVTPELDAKIRSGEFDDAATYETFAKHRLLW